MKTVQMTHNEDLVHERELERRHREGYERQPVQPGEFIDWEDEHRPPGQGPVALWDDELRRTSVDHDSISDEPETPSLAALRRIQSLLDHPGVELGGSRPTRDGLHRDEPNNGKAPAKQ